MHLKITKALIISLALGLSSCGYMKHEHIVGNQYSKYLRARLVAPINVPPELATNIALQDAYPIPCEQQVHGPLALEPIPPNFP